MNDIKVGVLNLEQRTLFDNEFYTLEEFPGDPNRLRVITTGGQKGPWFSRFWNPIGWDRFWPQEVQADSASTER